MAKKKVAGALLTHVKAQGEKCVGGKSSKKRSRRK
jgi:hypothetical protein